MGEDRPVTFDPYSESMAIAQELVTAGRPENGFVISEVIKGGVTSTEILMGLRHEFDAVLRAGPLSSELEARIRAVRAAVDQALRQ